MKEAKKKIEQVSPKKAKQKKKRQPSTAKLPKLSKSKEKN